MAQLQKIFGVTLVLAAISAPTEAASVTLQWDANTASEGVTQYWAAYASVPAGTTVCPAASGSDTFVQVTPATATTFEVQNLSAGTYCFRVYANNQNGRSAASNAAGPVTVSGGTTPPTPPTGGGLTLERGRLSFGGVRSGSTITQKTPTQTLMITQTTGTTPVAWTATTSNGRISVSPASGSGTRPLTVSLASTTLAVGAYDDTVTVTAGGATLTVAVKTLVYAAGTTTAAGGFFDTPTDGATNVAGAIPVTGWALDDVAVSRVDIYRDPVTGEGAAPVFLGTASFIAGSRPDVEGSYPEYPLNFRAGWGFMVLTNMLPDQTTGGAVGGNGAFRLHAYAIDQENNSTYLGAKRFTATNSASNKPFGTLDTPAQGGVVSGSAFAVFGWALSKAAIATNGSTINVYIDGAMVGHPVYNNNRSDIASLFPGYPNSNGAIGYYILNSTLLANGTHTISWSVVDSANQIEGIGSRFFVVQNGTGAVTSAGAVRSATLASVAAGDAVGQSVEAMAVSVPTNNSVVEVKKPTADDHAPQVLFPEATGEVNVDARETEQVEVRLANRFTDAGGTYEGYVIVDGSMRSLPVGSTLDRARGTFSWQPGPGFVGTYQFVFVRTLAGGFKTRIPVNITIAPKFDRAR